MVPVEVSLLTTVDLIKSTAPDPLLRASHQCSRPHRELPIKGSDPDGGGGQAVIDAAQPTPGVESGLQRPLSTSLALQ